MTETWFLDFYLLTSWGSNFTWKNWWIGSLLFENIVFPMTLTIFFFFKILLKNIWRYCFIFLVSYIIRWRFGFLRRNIILIIRFIRKCSSPWVWRIILLFFIYTWWFGGRCFSLLICLRNFSDICDNVFF